MINEKDKLLLNVALTSESLALESWIKWRADGINLAEAPRSAQRLYSFFYKRLEKSLSVDADLAILRQAYESIWTRNQKQVHVVSTAIKALQGAGCEVVLLKGIGLALWYYRDLGARGMNDCDLLVEPALVSTAVRALREAGWKASIKPTKQDHAWSFTNDRRNGIDLHRYAFHSCLWNEADDRLWSRSTAKDLGGTPVRMMSPEDLFLLVCTHGLRRNQESHKLVWIVDAMTILRSTPEFQWSLLQEEARARGLTLFLLLALSQLRDWAGPLIPPSVFEKLESVKVTKGEQAEFDVQLNRIPNHYERSPIAVVKREYIFYRAQTQRLGTSAHWPGFLIWFLTFVRLNYRQRFKFLSRARQ